MDAQLGIRYRKCCELKGWLWKGTCQICPTEVLDTGKRTVVLLTTIKMLIVNKTLQECQPTTIVYANEAYAK